MTERDRQTVRLLAQRLRWLADTLEYAEQGTPRARECLEEVLRPHLNAVRLTAGECVAVDRLYAMLSEE
jgi:hypothetical protein